jgi:hypothetical protein
MITELFAKVRVANIAASVLPKRVSGTATPKSEARQSIKEI